MLTKSLVRQKLLNDPNWEPEKNISTEEWEIFDEVYEEMEDNGELGLNTSAAMNLNDKEEDFMVFDDDDDDDDDIDLDEDE